MPSRVSDQILFRGAQGAVGLIGSVPVSTGDRHGTLAAYASGRLVRPAPDGAANLTAHVAFDACMAAVPGSTLTLQRDEIGAISLGEDPSAADVERHFASLRLRDRDRLGGVGWLRWDAHRDGLTPASTLPMW